MRTLLDQEVCRTSRLYARLLSRTKLTMPLLRRPPTGLIRDVFVEVLEKTGFGEGEFIQQELDGVSHTEVQMLGFLHKLAKLVSRHDPPGSGAMPSAEDISVSPLRKNILLQKLHEEALRAGVRVNCPDGRTRRVDLKECPTADVAVQRLQEEVFPGMAPLVRLQQQGGRLLPRDADLRAYRTGSALVALRRGELSVRIETRWGSDLFPKVSLQLDGELLQVPDESGARKVAVPEGRRCLRSQVAGMPAKEQQVTIKPGEEATAVVQVEVWVFAYSDPPDTDDQGRPTTRQVWLCADADHIPNRALPFRCSLMVPRGDGTSAQVKLPGGIDHQPGRVPFEEMVAEGDADAGGEAKRRCPLLDAHIEAAPNKDYLFRPKEGCDFLRLLQGTAVAVGDLRPSVTVMCHGSPHRVDILDNPVAGRAAERLAKEVGSEPKLVRVQHLGRVLGAHEPMLKFHQGNGLEMLLMGKVVARPLTGCCGELVQGAYLELDGEAMDVDASGDASAVAYAGLHTVRSRVAGLPMLDHPAFVAPGKQLDLTFPVEAWFWVFSRLREDNDQKDDPACITREVVLCAHADRVPPAAMPVLGHLRATTADGEELAFELSSGAEPRDVRAVRLPLEDLMRCRGQGGDDAADKVCPIAFVRVDVTTHCDFEWCPMDQSPFGPMLDCGGRCCCLLQRLLQGESVVMGHLKPVIHVESPDGSQLVKMPLSEHPTTAHALSQVAQHLEKKDDSFCLTYRGRPLERELPLCQVHGGPALRAVMFGEVRACTATKCCGEELPGMQYEVQGQERVPANDSGTVLLRAPAGKHTIRTWRADVPVDLRTVSFLPEKEVSQKFLLDAWVWVYAEAERPSESLQPEPAAESLKSAAEDKGEKSKDYQKKKRSIASALLKASQDGSLDAIAREAEEKAASELPADSKPPSPTSKEVRDDTASNEPTRPPTAADLTRPATADSAWPPGGLAGMDDEAGEPQSLAAASPAPAGASEAPEPALSAAATPATGSKAGVEEKAPPRQRKVWISANRSRIPAGAEPLAGLLYARCEGGGEVSVELATKGGQQGGTLVPLEQMAAQASKKLDGKGQQPTPALCPLHGLRLEPVSLRGYAWSPQEQSPLVERCQRVGGCELRRLLEGEPVLMGHLRPVVKILCGPVFGNRVVVVDLEAFPTAGAAATHVTKELQSELPVGLMQEGRLLPSTTDLQKCHGGYDISVVLLGCIEAQATTACCGEPVVGVQMELGECNAVTNAEGRATLVAPAGFQVLRSRRPGGHFQQQPVDVIAGGHVAANVPISPAIYVFAAAAALDGNGEVKPRQIWISADVGRMPEGAEPVRGLVYVLGKDGCEITQELVGGYIPQAACLPLHDMARRGDVCPLESIRLEPANNLDYAWHPLKPSPVEQRITTDGGCELSRLLHGEPLALGTLRPTVRVQCESGRVLKVDIEEFPTVREAAEYVKLVSGKPHSVVHLQQNGRVLDATHRLSACHAGPMVTVVALPESHGSPR